MKLALTVGYLGEGFSGSQFQPDKRTVEGEFIKAGISCKAWDDAKSASFRTAGRTDKGVSARRQLITVTPRDKDKFVEAINFHLPPDIWCVGYAEVDDDFYPRYSAGIRTYRYFFPYPLDIEAMQKAASYFVGVHDFSGFSKMETGRDPMRTVTSASVFIENGLPVFEVSAKSFLWNMVRGMAGILEAAGLGLTPPETVLEQLESHIWRVHPAPAGGLVFWDAETSLEFTPMRQRTAAKRQLFERAKEARTSAHAAEALLECGFDEYLRENAERNYGSFMKR
ncbi:MAG TPA: tRNA pseudouridine(38-40) synthase TruA [Methanocorpusculum sp.]|jgi:tRNA pseudouridine38-40 synthase|nr:tRNA pseudouridine(38-40) synthase TruA [Methanocorpusculum sp.]HJJ62320.1 tRNA pseudouridine(38-40) synthase TruA [Methanocorpusculum sp.]HJJ67523.1 tRNA pseudouridine(38-40) synthase TruA [Methanocorpusculum sp.]HJJ70328.1 tRNA pseudouridine(38-40) synthase TruA [Methanocorpusculum sp.]HJJ77055.1 tRNA pseudouridine(38-40) synthase TruA [Methanocorpusculum sp.]